MKKIIAGIEMEIPTKEEVEELHLREIQAKKQLISAQQKIDYVAQRMSEEYCFAQEDDYLKNIPLKSAIWEREYCWNYLDYVAEN